MPNYIRTQSPWLAAANAMQGVVDPMARMYSQLPQIQMQMQQNADQNALAHGRLQLEQQQQTMQAPVYESQAASHNAMAEKYKQDAMTQQLLNALSPQAGDAKRTSYLNQQGFVPGMPTRTNAGIGSQADLLAALAAAAVLSPSSAASAMQNEQAPVMMNQNQVAVDPFTRAIMGMGQSSVPAGNVMRPPTMGQQPSAPLQPGMFSSPYGNNVMNAQGGTVQQGQFRPPGTIQIPESTEALNVLKALEIADNLGMGTNIVSQLQAMLTGKGQMPQPTQQTNAPVGIKSIKQIR